MGVVYYIVVEDGGILFPLGGENRLSPPTPPQLSSLLCVSGGWGNSFLSGGGGEH